MKRFATLTILVLLTMLLLAGTASANLTGAVYGWANSNRSGETGASVYGEVYLGFAPLIRTVPGQLTHTAFQLNTNSCASCHMTHTAVGTNLLIANTTSATCNACHNGTMGFLDVEAPATATTMGGSVAAGTFGTTVGRTPSMHNVDTSGVLLSSAPGGLRTGTERGAWTPPFTCASCHAPHGSHSIRLLHVNPNNLAVRNIAATTTGVAGGRWSPNARATGFTVASATYDPVNDVYVYPTVHGSTYTAPWVSGSSRSVSGTAYGRLSIPWTRIYHAAWNPNLNGQADPTAAGWTVTSATYLLNRYFTINFATGRVVQTATQRSDLINFLQNAPFNLSATDAQNAPLNIDIARGLQVRARVSAAIYDDGSAGLEARLVTGARQINFLDPASYDAPAYNLFCAACHTDYLPTIRADDQSVTDGGVGTYSRKFRHTINRGASDAVSPMPVRGTNSWVAGAANLTGDTGTGTNQLMCLSCHFAHGADASMMLLADGTRVSANNGTAGTPTYSMQNDVSATLGGSSALKRYINQASCWHCHVRSSSTPFENTDYFWTMFPNGPTW